MKTKSLCHTPDEPAPLLTQIKEAQRALKHHAEVSQPAFNRWLNSIFAEELTELRELEVEQQQLITLIQEVSVYQKSHQVTHHHAYLAVIKRRQKFHQNHQEAQESQDARETHAPQSIKTKTVTETTYAELRNLYRQLARHLHPDHNPQLDEPSRELWHEVQTAYDQKNFEQLKTLAAVNGIQTQANLKNPAALQKELTATLNQLLKQIKLTQRRDPAWKFETLENGPKKLNSLYEKIDEQLTLEVSELQDAVEHNSEIIDHWKAIPASSQRARGRGRGHSRR